MTASDSHDAGEGFDKKLVRVERNRWVLGAAMSPAILTLVVLAATAVKPMLVTFAFHPLLAALALTVFAWRKNPWARRTHTQVRADHRGLRVGKDKISRASLRDGMVLPRHDGVRVVLHRKTLSVPIELEVDDIAEGRELLRGLHLDASQAVVRLRARSRIFASRFRFIGLIAATFVSFVALGTATHGPHADGLLAAFLPIAILVFAMVMPSRFSIGADGIELRWLGWKRFVSYKDLASVVTYSSDSGRANQAGVELGLVGGERLRIPLGQRGRDADRIGMIAERIREAQETYATGDAEGDASLLARGPRDLGAWISALRGIGVGANAGMRVAPVARDRLLRILEDPKGEPIARAAAAVALGADANADVRTRLVAAAEATALPKLRIAIEAAGKDDDAALEEALADVAEEPKPRARAST